MNLLIVNHMVCVGACVCAYMFVSVCMRISINVPVTTYVEVCLQIHVNRYLYMHTNIYRFNWVRMSVSALWMRMRMIYTKACVLCASHCIDASLRLYMFVGMYVCIFAHLHIRMCIRTDTYRWRQKGNIKIHLQTR